MSSTSPPPAVLPRAFGRYSLFDFIGKGGMAELYLARVPTELGGAKLLVVKKILPDFARNQKFCDLLISEAKLAARLSHTNVVQVVDLGRVESELFLAMEYVEGFDLNDLLRQCSKQKVALPVEFALLIATEALRGLDYAHRRTNDDGTPMGLIHRDVSPSNILVSFEGEVKVCDFGIARANDVASDAMEGTIQGKAGYMSPEQARGEAIDARADVFSMGVVLWELLAGRRMYKAEAGEALLDVARRGERVALPTRDLPNETELVAIVERALAPLPADRYPSAQVMLRELEAYVGKSRLIASSLRLGTWLRDSFGAEMLERRRSRERVARALEMGPPVKLEAIGSAPASGRRDDDAPITSRSAISVSATRAARELDAALGASVPASKPGSSGLISKPGASGPISTPDASEPSSALGVSGPTSTPGASVSLSTRETNGPVSVREGAAALRDSGLHASPSSQDSRRDGTPSSRSVPDSANGVLTSLDERSRTKAAGSPSAAVSSDDGVRDTPPESRLSTMGMDVSPPSQLVPASQLDKEEGGVPGYVWIALVIVVLIGVVIWQTQH